VVEFLEADHPILVRVCLPHHLLHCLGVHLVATGLQGRAKFPCINVTIAIEVEVMESHRVPQQRHVRRRNIEILEIIVRESEQALTIDLLLKEWTWVVMLLLKVAADVRDCPFPRVSMSRSLCG